MTLVYEATENNIIYDDVHIYYSHSIKAVPDIGNIQGINIVNLISLLPL